MTWCHDCGSDVWVALAIAIATALGVAFGYAIRFITPHQRAAARLRGVVLFVALTFITFLLVYQALLLVLPFVGVLVGLFHRKSSIPSIFANRRV